MLHRRSTRRAVHPQLDVWGSAGVCLHLGQAAPPQEGGERVAPGVDAVDLQHLHGVVLQEVMQAVRSPVAAQALALVPYAVEAQHLSGGVGRALQSWPPEMDGWMDGVGGLGRGPLGGSCEGMPIVAELRILCMAAK
jgi:hypothetical protein